MKCPKCGTEVKGCIEGSDVHRKTRVWTCKNCGIIKNQFLIDGEVMRTWVIDDE